MLITGGRTQDSTTLTFVTHTDVLIYNPASQRFTTVGPLSVPRNGHSTTLLPEGSVQRHTLDRLASFAEHAFHHRITYRELTA